MAATELMDKTFKTVYILGFYDSKRRKMMRFLAIRVHFYASDSIF